MAALVTVLLLGLFGGGYALAGCGSSSGESGTVSATAPPGTTTRKATTGPTTITTPSGTYTVGPDAPPNPPPTTRTGVIP